MLGRAAKNEPVWMASVAWKCSLLSVVIELMRQTSSIRSRRCGKRSLTRVPQRPPRRKGQRAPRAGRRSRDSPPPGTVVRRSAAWVSFGLWSKVSMCETPPVENRKMMRRAFGAKCGSFGASGSPDGRLPARCPSEASSSARMPGSRMEPPTRERRARRRVIPKVFLISLLSSEQGRSSDPWATDLFPVKQCLDLQIVFLVAGVLALDLHAKPSPLLLREGDCHWVGEVVFPEVKAEKRPLAAVP